jgi:hypothetical protein
MTKIFGRDIGVVIEHYRAEPIAVGLWEVTITRRRAMRDGWHDETTHPAEESHDWESDVLEEVASDPRTHRSEESARREAIEHFRENSVAIALSHAESMRHNMDMIRTLAISWTGFVSR